MTLITPYGRFDRAAVMARARVMLARGASWANAMRGAYAEAQLERNAFASTRRVHAPSAVRNCRRLAAEADALSELEDAK